ncbi:MAG: hypothetical protein K1X94_24420 [Sandaracinaceae bacterium]|nr:hypothetical protein [Sandaracinaceae bacterium]
MASETISVDPVELVAAMLRRRGGARSCVDLASGEVHRSVEECDPEEDDRKLDDPSRYAPIDPLDAAEVAAFWARVDRPEFQGATGLYQPLSGATGEARARLLEVVRDVARGWLSARGLAAELRARD